jgi:hypothetical protein
VGLCWVRLGWITLGYVRLNSANFGLFRLGCVKIS